MTSCISCTGIVDYCVETESEIDLESSETTTSSTDSTSKPECPVAVDTTTCIITYPACEQTSDHVRFMTHASHDCKTTQYPPKFCEYMGDVVCSGQVAGVWCCK